MSKYKNKFFSIVIPTLNEEGYLPKLLDDLFKQSEKNLEIIIVDANSTDKTVRKATPFKAKFKDFNIYQSTIKNVAYQRNLGAKKAKGKWILFMDADDRIPNDFLKELNKNLSMTTVDIFTTKCKVDASNILDKVVENYINLTGEVNRRLGYPGAIGAMIGIRSDIFSKVGGFKQNFIPYEDGEFIRDAVKMDYIFELFNEPKFTFSLRRFRKEGHINVAINYVILKIKRVMKLSIDQQNEYPMGGSIKISK